MLPVVSNPAHSLPWFDLVRATKVVVTATPVKGNLILQSMWNHSARENSHVGHLEPLGSLVCDLCHFDDHQLELLTCQWLCILQGLQHCQPHHLVHTI